MAKHKLNDLTPMHFSNGREFGEEEFGQLVSALVRRSRRIKIAAVLVVADFLLWLLLLFAVFSYNPGSNLHSDSVNQWIIPLFAPLFVIAIFIVVTGRSVHRACEKLGITRDELSEAQKCLMSGKYAWDPYEGMKG